MKKIITLFAVVLAAGSAFALDMEVSGEIKTGLFAERRELGGEAYSHARIHNNDGDSGLAEGRIRLGINLTMENFGIRTRFYQEDFKRGTDANDTNIIRIKTDFAYAYGNLLAGQLKISAGLLGESPWGSGGPELWKELEQTVSGSPITGMRAEYMPRFAPGLNVGLVLNRQDDTVPGDAKEQFGDLFMESIAGIAYEHDYFAFRFAYRFDRGIDSPAAVVIGDRLVYRVEERILGTLLPGMAVWANGYYEGINAEGKKGSGRGTPGYGQNWLYISYDPEYFTAGLDVGYRDGFVLNAQQLEFRPSFYYKFFDNFLVVGVMCGMEMGFNGAKSFEDAFYNFWFVEPQVRANINSNLYAAAVYRYVSGAYKASSNKDQNTHWVNIRLVYKL